jgi:hypothetical protein
MASYEGVLELLKKEQGPVEPPGVVSSFKRGLYRSPADVDAMANFMRGRSGDRFSQLGSGLTFDQSLAEASGVPEPTTYAGRVAERLGRTAPFVAASMPAIGASAASPLLALRNEVIGDVMASMAEQGADDMGAGPGIQMAAGLAAGIVAPGSVGDDTARLSKSSRVVTESASPFSKEITDAATGKAEELAKTLNVKMASMKRASSEAKRRMSSDPFGNEQFLVKGRDKLEEAKRLFPDKRSRPSTAQILNDEPAVVGMEAALAQVDDEMRQSLAGRRKVVVADLVTEFENLLPEGSAGGVNLRAKSAYANAKAAEQADWSAVPMAQMPTIDVRGAKRIVAALRSGPPEARKYIPSEAKFIETMPHYASAERVQALMSELLDSQRAAREFGAADHLRRRAKRIGPIITELRKQFDAIPANEGGAEFRRARESTRRLHELFDPEAEGFDALANLTDGRSMIRRIKSSSDPEGEAARAVRIMDQEPGGRENLARVAIDELFDEDLGARTPRSILIDIRRKRPVYSTILGPERLALFENLLTKAQMARNNKAGTTAAVHSTGSGIGPVDILFGAAESVAEPIQGAKKLARYIAKSAATDREKNAILREALYDSEYWQTLIEMPEPRAVAKWMVDWDTIVARSRAREAARSGLRSANASRDEQR